MYVFDEYSSFLEALASDRLRIVSEPKRIIKIDESHRSMNNCNNQKSHFERYYA